MYSAYYSSENKANKILESLWRATIVQVCLDLTSNSQTGEAIKARREAEIYFRSKDFITICDYANLNPDYVREKVKAYIDKGAQWRLPAGQGWRTKLKREMQKNAH